MSWLTQLLTVTAFEAFRRIKQKRAQEAIGSEPCAFELLRDNLPELAGHFGPQANKHKTGQKIKSPTILNLPEIAKKNQTIDCGA